jgi:isoleucyl-tRNA synthetase
LLPWWNAYSFFVTYARIDGWTPPAPGAPAPAPSTNLLDRWILSSLETLTRRVVQAMDVYDLQRAVKPFLHFIEELTNWYIRRSRRRFWKSTDDADKQQAYATLYQVLLRLCRIAAPFTPFISDAIYRNLRTPDQPASVHLCDFPVSDDHNRDQALEAQMQDVMTVVTLGRGLRTDHNLKVRQPLQGIHIACRDPQRLARIRQLQDILADELNVREVGFGAHEADLVTLSAKADYRRLGPRLGPRMKAVAAAIQHLGNAQCESLLAGQSFSLDVDGEAFEIEPGDVIVERHPKADLAVAADGDLVVALHVNLNPDLVRDGLARELLNKVQQMRKQADLVLTRRIRVAYQADDEIAEALDQFGEYVAGEVLAETIERVAATPPDAQGWDINGHPVMIAVYPVNE